MGQVVKDTTKAVRQRARRRGQLGVVDGTEQREAL